MGDRANAPPGGFLEHMAGLLGDEYPRFADSYKTPGLTGLRANDLKISADVLMAALAVDWQPVPWCPAGFVISSSRPLGRHPYHAAGLFYLQEPSAMAAVQVMAPQPGERVLDLCGAPGGKATHIASLLANQGLLVANDVHSQRVRALAENLERWGATNAVILNETPERLAERFGSFFDRVLVDAPCSGEAMFRRNESARVHWSHESVEGCGTRQRALLTVAAKMVRPGGWLCYSTCAFSARENEGVVASFLDLCPDFQMVEPSRSPGLDPGRPEWVETSQPVARSVRIWPHRAPGEGHFIALMRRAGQGLAPPAPPQPSRALAPALQSLSEFCRDTLTAEIEGEVRLVGNRLYRVSSCPPDLEGLRVVHPGWWLGTLRPGRFEPSHALAMGLQGTDVHRGLDLPAESPEVLAYLQGNTLQSSGEDGWLAISVDGHTLGWGKRIQGTVKNHYPKGLRWPHSVQSAALVASLRQDQLTSQLGNLGVH